MKNMLSDNVLIDVIKEELNSNGMILSANDKRKIRYKRGRVIKFGPDCDKIKEGDEIIYDENRSFTIPTKEGIKTVVSFRGIVGVD